MTSNDQSPSRVQTVLIAEDNDQTMGLMKKFFDKANQRKDLNCNLIKAKDGNEAVHLLKTQEPDLILCDIHMPQKDGFEVLKFYNQSYREKHPFCFFTFLTASTEEKKRAFTESVMGFMAKNEINYFVLALQVKTWLRLAYLERTLEIKTTNRQFE